MLATTIHKSNTTPHHQRWSDNQATHSRSGDTPGFPHAGRRGDGLVVSKPNSVSGNPINRMSDHSNPAPVSTFVVAPEPHPLQARSISRIAQVTEPPHNVGGPIGLVVLLRKEVIQPHLPVRLPCYDFVPIADPTFDGSPPYGLGHRLRVLPTFMT